VTRAIKAVAKDALQFWLFRGSFAWRLPSGTRSVALTFDDGPDPVFTTQVLEVLARQRVPATFFLVGRKAVARPELVQAIARAGHAIGNHSHAHVEYTQLSRSGRLADWTAAQSVFAQILQFRPTLFRPPRGRISLAVLRHLRALNQRLILWTRTSSDYRQDGADAIYARVHPDAVRPGEILLFHDHNAGTVAAIARLIPELLGRGFRFQHLLS